MPVHFPDYPDVHLRNAPLQEVICQIKFPVLFRISSENPYGFQELVRSRFPHVEIEHPIIVGPLGEEKAQAQLQPRIFRFRDQQQSYSVVLAPDFLALVCQKYSGWREFSEALRFVYQAFQKEYDIEVATRIGLRYINILTINNTKASGFHELLQILRPEFTIWFKVPEIEAPNVVKHEIRASVENDGHLTMRFGIPDGETEQFALDFDRYTENKTHPDELLERCDNYHRCVYNAFRWAIADGKLAIFDPIE